MPVDVKDKKQLTAVHHAITVNSLDAVKVNIMLMIMIKVNIMIKIMIMIMIMHSDRHACSHGDSYSDSHGYSQYNCRDNFQGTG